MPFEIVKRGKEYCVQTKGGGRTHGCHPSKKKARAQMRALYANVPEARR
jgi:hypothetical protein